MARITIIGAGNVGYHLANRLFECGHTIIEVYSRTAQKAIELATVINSKPISNLEQINQVSDVYILAIKDDAIAKVAVALQLPSQALIAHTSGSVSSAVFKDKFSHYGVFYPLQTFSRQRKADFNQLPFCIYGNTEATESTLQNIAQSICPNVYLIDDPQRASLHVAAVIVNNFTNFMFGMAHDICQQENVSFEILKPLINETLNKIDTHEPFAVQTGPAARGDLETIERHLIFLERSPIYKLVYKSISQGIIAQMNQKPNE